MVLTVVSDIQCFVLFVFVVVVVGGGGVCVCVGGGVLVVCVCVGGGGVRAYVRACVRACVCVCVCDYQFYHASAARLTSTAETTLLGWLPGAGRG